MDLNKILNPVIGVAGLLSLALSATLSLANSNETIKIKVKTDDGIAETVVIENLEVGMTDVFVTESGKEVLVTREQGTLTLEVDGKIIDIKMPRIESLHMSDLEGHQFANRLMFISEGGHLHDFSGDGDHFFSCSTDSDVCDSHAKAIWIDSAELDGEIVIDDLDGVNVFVKRIELHQGGNVDLDELLEELNIEIDVMTEGSENHEVMIIKRHVEIHTESEDN